MRRTLALLPPIAQTKKAAREGPPWGLASSRLHLDVAAVLALERALQLVECRVLDLPDALARQVILVTDLAERALLVVAETEALGEHVGLDRRQVMQQALDLRRQGLRRQIIRRRVLLGLR